VTDENKLVPEIRFKGFADAWEQCKLGEVAELSSSKRIHVSDYVSEGIPFYRGSEISTGGVSQSNELFISSELYNDIKERYGVPEKGDLLITAVGTLGNLWKVDDRQFYYKDGNLIRISGLNIGADFLIAYLMDGQGKKKILDSAAGSNQKALTMVKLNEIEFFVPIKLEQTAIGNFFRIIDNTITANQRKLDKLKQLKAAYLQQMFPRAGERLPRVRFAGFAGEWEEVKLNDIGEILTGSTPPTDNADNYSNDGMIWITPTDINSLTISTSAKHLSEQGQKIARKVPPHTILVTCIASIGKNTMTLVPASFNQQMNAVIPNENYHPYFLLIQSELWSKQMKNITASTTMQIVNKTEFSKILTIVPSLPEQICIGNFFCNLNAQIDAQNQKLEQLKQLKTAYLQKMFI